MAKYSYDFKKRVVEDYINNKGGYRYLANKYQLPDYRIVRQWVANYKAFGDKNVLDNVSLDIDFGSIFGSRFQWCFYVVAQW